MTYTVEKTRVQELIGQATNNGIFDIERYTELLVGDCVAAVLFAEVSLSSYMAALIEEKIGFEQKYFNNEWFEKNYECFEEEE